jgi:FKBP-type peptidyl-prolyl cis-trans isomerase SlpA
MSDKKRVTATSEALAHITIKLKDGTVADSTKVNTIPTLVRLGDGSLSAAIEQNLLGLAAGDTKAFDVSAEQGYGFPNPANLHRVEKNSFPAHIKLQPGVIVAFEQINGQTLPGVIRTVEEEQVLVDFNHPLCGQPLFFEVEIVEVLS